MAQQTENHMKQYRKRALVQAKLFEEGDEDVNEDGSISTSGFIGKHSIEVPYVSTLENQKHMSRGFGKDYICVGVDGERWLVEKSIFERTYEEVTQ